MVKGEKKEAKKEAPKKAPKKAKIQKIRALIRLSHRDKTYEAGEVFEEGDKEMAKQIIDKGFGEKAN